jgi:hypothetical protein
MRSSQKGQAKPRTRRRRHLQGNQIYGNVSKLLGYAIHRDGSLDEITSATIPYNSPQGLTGF